MSSEVPDLTAASTPLGGTEELHVVQSSNSRKTTVAELRKGTFLALTDTMGSFTANALLVTNGAGDAVASGFVVPASLGTSGQVLKVNSGETALEFADESGVGALTDLSDTPSSLGTAGQVLKVNSGETALEFADESGGGDVAVEDDGTSIVAAATTLNFTGAGVTVTDAGSNQVDIDIPGGGGGGGGGVLSLGSVDFGAASAQEHVFDVSDGYIHLILVGRNVDATGSGDFRNNIQFSDDGGSNYDVLTRAGYMDPATDGLPSGTADNFNLSLDDNNSTDFTLHLYKEPDGKWNVWGWLSDGTSYVRAVLGFVEGDFDTIRFRDVGSGPTTYDVGILELYAVQGGAAIVFDNETATSYNLTDTDLGGSVYKEMDNASDITVTVPSGLTGTEPVTFEQTGAGQVIFSAGGGVTINAFDSADRTAGQYATATLIPKGSDVYTLMGNIVGA